MTGNTFALAVVYSGDTSDRILANSDCNIPLMPIHSGKEHGKKTADVASPSTIPPQAAALNNA